VCVVTFKPPTPPTPQQHLAVSVGVVARSGGLESWGLQDLGLPWPSWALQVPRTGPLGQVVPGPGPHASRQILTSDLSRNSLADLEPSLVQATLGQLVQLFCPGDTSPEPQARWQKDGRPISSDRCV
jgi:hypothetical protein